MKCNGRILWAAAYALILSLSAGCASLSPINPKQALEERVGNYMQARTDGEWNKVYTFFDPSYRERVSLESFVHTPKNILFKTFKVEEINVSPSENQATVKLRIDIALQGVTFPDAPQTQHWIKESGEWFLKKAGQKMNPFTKQE